MKTSPGAAFWVLTVICAAPAAAEVRETQSGSFIIESFVLADAAPARVYAELIKVGRWWHPDHTYSGRAGNLRLEPRAGGCFCEKLPGGGSVQHARVLFAQPGKLLRLEGGLGPLQEMPVTGVLTFTLVPDGPGTRITMNYQVAGAFPTDSAALASAVDQVMGLQLIRLQTHIRGN